MKLAEWVVGYGTMHDRRSDTVVLEAVPVRYYQQHARTRCSADQGRYALRRWSNFFPAAAVSEVTPVRLRAFVAAMRKEGLSDGSIRRTLAVS